MGGRRGSRRGLRGEQEERAGGRGEGACALEHRAQEMATSKAQFYEELAKELVALIDGQRNWVSGGGGSDEESERESELRERERAEREGAS